MTKNLEVFPVVHLLTQELALHNATFPSLGGWVDYLAESAEKALALSLAAGFATTWRGNPAVRSDRLGPSAFEIADMLREYPAHQFHPHMLHVNPDSRKKKSLKKRLYELIMNLYKSYFFFSLDIALEERRRELKTLCFSSFAFSPNGPNVAVM